MNLTRPRYRYQSVSRKRHLARLTGRNPKTLRHLELLGIREAVAEIDAREEFARIRMRGHEAELMSRRCVR